MKIIHLSDLHLGKRFAEYSLIEDQKYILQKIIEIIKDKKPNAVCIAGDVYDKTVPSTEAVELFDDFLYSLSQIGADVFVISGNHDSPERLAFGNRIFDASGIHFSPVYDGEVKPIALNDEFGEVNFYMLPFVKPSHVKRFFPDENIENYTDAVQVAVKHMNVDYAKRNVLIAHQFVTGSIRSDSEEKSVGGLDNVDSKAFDGFDYVALGHIHGAQTAGKTNVYYCGTPLKYSFSEANDQKSVALIEINKNGEPIITKLPLTPKREVVDLCGKYDELMSRSFYENTTYRDDLVRITLTDEDDILNAAANLRVVYRGLAELRYDNTRTRTVNVIDSGDSSEKKPFELFAELYRLQNGRQMTECQADYVKDLIEKIWEE